MVVDKQVSLAFTLGKYSDEVLCDMVHIEATHIFLGRPWQYDLKVIHDGVTNRFSFVHMGQKVTLKPFSLREVIEDQLKMKIKREKKTKRTERKRKGQEESKKQRNINNKYKRGKESTLSKKITFIPFSY
ncbi:hypothetical protein CR513_28176, partial [Mucuna pruriens]